MTKLLQRIESFKVFLNLELVSIPCPCQYRLRLGPQRTVWKDERQRLLPKDFPGQEQLRAIRINHGAHHFAEAEE